MIGAAVMFVMLDMAMLASVPACLSLMIVLNVSILQSYRCAVDSKSCVRKGLRILSNPFLPRSRMQRII